MNVTPYKNVTAKKDASNKVNARTLQRYKVATAEKLICTVTLWKINYRYLNNLQMQSSAKIQLTPSGSLVTGESIAG